MKFFKRLIHPKSKKSSKNPTTDAELGGQRVVDPDSVAIPVRSSSIQIEWVNIISSSHFNEIFFEFKDGFFLEFTTSSWYENRRSNI